MAEEYFHGLKQRGWRVDKQTAVKVKGVFFMSHKLRKTQGNPSDEDVGEGLSVKSCFGGWAMGLELCTSTSAGKTSYTSAWLGKSCFGVSSKLVILVRSKGEACRDLRRNAGIGRTDGPFLLPPAVPYPQSCCWHI